MSLGVLTGLWSFMVLLGAAMEWRARRESTRIPHRVLVFGGRGKTTLVHLVHAGLLASSKRAVGRVSGDDPVFLGADGSRHILSRFGPANIREIPRLFHRVRRLDLDAAVIENMAIQPRLQAVVARRMVRPTLAVMAPDALDHLEVLPLDKGERLRLFVETLPENTPLLLPEDAFHSLQTEGLGGVSDRTTSVPAYLDAHLRPHMAVLAGLAMEAVKRVCGDLSEAARATVVKKAGSMQRILAYRRGHVAWVDAFSANDPAAATTIAELARQQAQQRGFAMQARLFNHRLDRPSRLPLFSSLLDHAGPSWIMGQPFPRPWSRKLRAARLTGSPEKVVSTIEHTFVERQCRGFVLCLGNTGGMGKALRQWLASHAEVETW